MPAESTAKNTAPSHLGVILFVVAALLVLALAFLSRFHGFKIYDDAYMFVRYADHILAGQGMVWNVGDEQVYGATSIAYVFAVIPFRLIFPHNPAAAIFSSSFFWGLVFLALLFRLALRVMEPRKELKPYAMGFVFLALVATSVSLRAHFASGMETTFVMSYLTLVISLVERLRQGKGNAWLTGIVMGIAWWIRPDLLIFAVGLPALLVMLNWKSAERAVWLRVLLLGMAGTCLCLVGAHLLTGAWLPLSFFAKTTGLYGAEFAKTYRWTPLAESARFLGRSWPPLVALGLGLFLKWRRIGAAYSDVDKAMVATMLVFGVYFSFFVLQVMGYGQRFYYPLFPFLVYLALRELLTLQDNLKQGPGFQFTKIPSNIERGGILVLSGLLLYYGVDSARSLKLSDPGEHLAVFDAGRTYKKDLQDYWARLDAIAGLPDALSIATTEVGMPAALYPQRIIYDLAGLNSPALVREGLTAEAVLLHCPADLIYMPHEHYAQFSNSLTTSQEFGKRYTVLLPLDVKAAMGVAIRNDSPFAPALRKIFGQ
jgi:hypothetical protein